MFSYENILLAKLLMVTCVRPKSCFFLLRIYFINNQLLTFFIDVYTDAALRLHSTIAIDDCPILVLSEYRNFTTSEKTENFNKTDTNGNGGVNK